MTQARIGVSSYNEGLGKKPKQNKTPISTIASFPTQEMSRDIVQPRNTEENKPFQLGKLRE